MIHLPHSLCDPSLLVDVAHQGPLPSLPSLVHAKYSIPWYLKGNSQYFPLAVTQSKQETQPCEDRENVTKFKMAEHSYWSTPGIVLPLPDTQICILEIFKCLHALEFYKPRVIQQPEKFKVSNIWLLFIDPYHHVWRKMSDIFYILDIEEIFHHGAIFETPSDHGAVY